MALIVNMVHHIRTLVGGFYLSAEKQLVYSTAPANRTLYVSVGMFSCVRAPFLCMNVWVYTCMYVCMYVCECICVLVIISIYFGTSLLHFTLW